MTATAFPSPSRQPLRRRRPGPMRRLVRWTAGLTRFLIATTLFFALLVLGSYWVVGWFIRGKEVVTPNLTGQSIKSAMDLASKEGLYLSTDKDEPHPTVPEGDIISQNPAPGERIKKGTPVRVTVSAGSAMVIVPVLKGKPRAEAIADLHTAGLESGAIDQLPVPGKPGGIVIESDPPAGAGTGQGRKVNLLITAGQREISTVMPNLIGRNVADARVMLVDSGLRLPEERREAANGYLPGQIHRQTPEPGAPVSPATLSIVYYASEADGSAAPADGAAGVPAAPEIVGPESLGEGFAR